MDNQIFIIFNRFVFMLVVQYQGSLSDIQGPSLINGFIIARGQMTLRYCSWALLTALVAEGLVQCQRTDDAMVL